MTRIFRVLGAITIVLILIVVIPTDSKSDVVISNNYNVNTSSKSPSIVYNNSTISYVTITIYNNQSVSTVPNFQMLIKVDWLEYENYLNSYCSNVRFYNTTSAIGKTSGYGVLPAWIETNDTNTATSSNVWINMKGTIIPASGSVDIYMAFLPKSISWNAYLGLNPSLSSTYGQFDNGANVFLYYNNGLNLMPLSQTGTGGSAPKTTTKAPSPYTHAITGSVNGGTANANTWTTNGITSSSSPSFNLPTSYIAQMNVYLTGSSALTDILTNVQSINTGHFYVFRFDTRSTSGYNDGIGYYSNGASITTFLNLSNIKSKTNVWYMMTAIDNSDNLYIYQNGYSSASTFTLNNFGTLIARAKGLGYSGGGIAVSTDGATSTDYWTMILVRAYPPNGVMPSYSFSNILSPAMWQTNLNSYKDQAYSNITSIWSSGIYCDDYGNVFWTDTYGSVFVNWSSNNQIEYLGTPYSYFAYAGPITSIAAVNFTYGRSYQYVVLLTYKGYVFGYNVTNNTWFNATSTWNLPLTQYPAPWTSVTSNTEGMYNNYYEYFFFTDLYGNVYRYNVVSPGYDSGWLLNTYTTSSNLNIISTAISYDGYLYSICYGGNVYVYTTSGWNTYYSSTQLNGLKSIVITYGGYIYLLRLNNGTKLYVSSNTAGSSTGTFSSYGNVVFSQGTNEALTIDRYYGIFWAIQTNGTIAKSTNNANSWTYLNNHLSKYSYPTILAINSTYTMNFNAYAHYVNSINYTSMYNFALYFNGSNGILNLEYRYQLGSMNNPQIPALLTKTSGILINVTMMPNMAYNSTFYFYVIFYPQNNPNSVILEYVLDIHIINHFSYITI